MNVRHLQTKRKSRNTTQPAQRGPRRAIIQQRNHRPARIALDAGQNINLRCVGRVPDPRSRRRAINNYLRSCRQGSSSVFPKGPDLGDGPCRSKRIRPRRQARRGMFPAWWSCLPPCRGPSCHRSLHLLAGHLPFARNLRRLRVSNPRKCLARRNDLWIVIFL